MPDFRDYGHYVQGKYNNICDTVGTRMVNHVPCEFYSSVSIAIKFGNVRGMIHVNP